MEIVVKQPLVYINLAHEYFVEPYDHVLVKCECGRLMERGVGLCDVCINRESRLMEAWLRKVIGK